MDYSIPCPRFVEYALDALSSAWAVMRLGDNPFSNTGARYTGVNFTVEAYSWDFDNFQDFNFMWRDVKVAWYKHLGRGMYINRQVSSDEVTEMFSECMSEMLSIKSKSSK